MHQHWRTKSNFSAWSRAPACFSSLSLNVCIQRFERQHISQATFKTSRVCWDKYCHSVVLQQKYSLNWYICYIQLTANMTDWGWETHRVQTFRHCYIFEDGFSLWELAMVRQGYTAHSPHKDTPLLLNDVEEERFLYRCGTLALPELFPHYFLTFPG